jgi:putative DNA primase/helicase
VWGGATDPGFVRSWRGTANAQESGAALVSDTVLCLDEIGVAEARDAAAAAYQLATGIGKGRSHRDGMLREPMTWRVLTLSTGEIAMAAKVSEDCTRRAYAGQAVRLLDVPADAGHGHGVFDGPVAEGDAGRLADAIKQPAITSYGTADPAFVRRLIGEDPAEVGALVSEMVDAFQTSRLPCDADGQVRRAAAQLGLIGAAGEVAREWGIVPWAEGEAMEAAARALADWIATRGGTEPAQVREAILQVRRFFEAHGEARFEPVEGGADARPVPDRVGWRKGFGSERTWFVLPELWKAEVCAGFDAVATARVLAELGILKLDAKGGKLQRSERTPYGTKRVYVLTAEIFEEDA